MAWDIALDKATGDWLFDSRRDLEQVVGPEVDRQRIFLRCKIPRGSFIYDEDDSLGSNLHLISRHPSEQQLQDARGYISEALDGMDGVTINSIDVKLTTDEETGFPLLTADVSFTPTAPLDDEDAFDDADAIDAPALDASVVITE